MIYFDNDKQAYAYEIEKYIASVDRETWRIYANTGAGIGWDIVDGEFTPLTSIENILYEAEIPIRRSERRSLYIVADEEISKCDNYILLDMDVEEYTRLKMDWLQYKMAVRNTKNQESFPFEVVYPDMPEDV